MSLTPQIPLDLSPTTPNSFDNFLISDSNTAAVKLVRAWPEWPTPIVMIIGPDGSGKTHLGQAWAHETKAIFIDDARQISETELFTVLNQALNGEISGLLLADKMAPSAWNITMPDLRSRLKNIPLAIIQEPDDEILEPIVRRLFEDRGRIVSQDLIAYLLKYQERSVSAQRDIALKLEAAAQQQKADLTKSFAARFLKD